MASTVRFSSAHGYPRRLRARGILRNLFVTRVFDAFWQFAAERQNILYKRLQNIPSPWTSDPILAKYKFTNAYRVTDRVSQYLVRDVIYSVEHDIDNYFFRILLFKLFNRIDTWELLLNEIGSIYWNKQIANRVVSVMDHAMSKGRRIYSAAYIMAPGAGEFSKLRKHEAHMKLLQMMMRDKVPSRLQQCPSMQEAFFLLRNYPMIGNFLAYQLVTDLNYSPITNFTEIEFTIPGPGAHDGIRKCFLELAQFSETDVIKLMYDIQAEEFESRGIEFKMLCGRPLQFIDIQNLFCEIGKYSRVAFPEALGPSGRMKIKQLFRPRNSPISLFLPPKWNLNEKLSIELSHPIDLSTAHQPRYFQSQTNLSFTDRKAEQRSNMQVPKPSLRQLLDSLQSCQWRHDRNYHQDILAMPTQPRLIHFTLHQIKYAGKLAEANGKNNPEMVESILVDCLIIALATANTLSLRLANAIPTPTRKDSIHMLHIEPLGHMSALVAATGHMAKALESLDHVERFDARGELEKQTVVIVNHVLTFAGERNRDIDDLVRKRWAQIEVKFETPDFTTGRAQRDFSSSREDDSVPLFLRASN